MAESVLVTGGAGYLGSILTGQLLKQGFRVTVLDNLMYGEQSLFHLCSEPRFQFVLGDVRDQRVVRRLVVRSGRPDPPGRDRRGTGMRSRSCPDRVGQFRGDRPPDAVSHAQAASSSSRPPTAAMEPSRDASTAPRRRRWSRSRSTVGPRSRPRRRCCRAQTRSRCGWPRSSARLRGCASTCWSITSYTRPSPNG